MPDYVPDYDLFYIFSLFAIDVAALLMAVQSMLFVCVADAEAR